MTHGPGEHPMLAALEELVSQGAAGYHPTLPLP